MYYDNTFRTVYKPVKSKHNISYKSNIMFAGSCFSENIGNMLKDLKFSVNINPFGILYNPLSVADALDFIIENKEFTKDDLFFFNEYWHSFYHHGRFSFTSAEKSLREINNSVKEAFNFLKNTDFLFITFGSARVYIFKETGKIVANCHKVPSYKFDKKLLDEDFISERFNLLIKRVRKFNPEIKIFFSVSPVRHLKDGFEENFLSKSVLRVSVGKIIKSDQNSFYFPSFELLNDDLRDYRFYDFDMLHPRKIAVEYIFDFFKTMFFENETVNISNEIKKIVSAFSHKIFDKETAQTKKFAESTLKKINDLSEKYDFIDLEKEKNYFLGLK